MGALCYKILPKKLQCWDTGAGEQPGAPVIGDGLGGNDVAGREEREVGDVDEYVDDGDEGDGDEDCEGHVAPRLLDLLGDKVELVPPVVGPKGGVAGQGQGAEGQC